MIWFIIAIIVVLVIFVITSYNGLVKSRMQTKEAWSQIDVQLKRRNDLLPNLSDELTRLVSGIFAVAESYPDLKASANFSQLQEELTNTENKIAYSRQLYNSVTSNYNVKLETFPSNGIAKKFSIKAAEFLETPEEEKAVPKVDFSGLGN